MMQLAVMLLVLIEILTMILHTALPFVLIMPIIRNWSITRDAPDEALETGFGVIVLCANPDNAPEIEHTIFTSSAHPMTRHRVGWIHSLPMSSFTAAVDS